MSKQADLESLQRVNDRLSSTKVEDVCSVLSALIPKLLPMSGDPELADVVTNMLLNTIIPKLNLLTASTIKLQGVFAVLGSPSSKVNELTVTFVDAVIDKHESHADDEACAKELLLALSKFELFSLESNAICYYLLRFLKVVPTSVLALRNDASFDKSNLATIQSVLGDYFLDVMLLYKPVLVSTAASEGNLQSNIQFGLSAQRIARICAKKTSFTLAELKVIKMFIIDHLPTNFLPPAYSVAISITASCDSSDTDTVMGAMYKVNGAVNLFKIDTPEIASQTLELLLTWCSGANLAPTATNSRELVVWQLNILRSKLKNDVLIAALRFVAKDLVQYLASVVKPLLSLVYKNVITANTSGSEGSILISNTALPLVAISLKLYEELCVRIDEASLKASTVVFVQCVKKVLATYTFNLESTAAGGTIASTSSKSSEVNNKEHHLAIRSSCYAIIAQLAKNSALLVLDINLLILIFQLLKNEDERILASMYGALESLRVAHRGSSATNLESKASLALRDLMIRSRSSADLRQKLACIQWVRTLFSHHDIVVLDTLLTLADDPLPSIVDAVNVEMEKLLGVMTEEAKESFEKYSAVQATLLNAFKSNEWMFAGTSATAAEQLGMRGLAARYHLVKILGEVTAQRLKRTAQYDDKTAVLDSFNGYDPFKDHVWARENRSMSTVDEVLYPALCEMLNSLTSSNGVNIELKHSATLLPGTADNHKAALSASQLKMNSQLLKTVVLLVRDSFLLTGCASAKNYCRTHGMISSLMSFLVLPDLSLSLHVAQCMASLCFSDLNFSATTRRILGLTVINLNIVDGALNDSSSVVSIANALQCMSCITEVLVEPGLTEKAVLQDVTVMYETLLSEVAKALTLVNKSSTKVPLSYEANYLVVNCLRALSRLASRKLLSCDTTPSWLIGTNLESIQSLLSRIPEQLLCIFSESLNNGLSSAVVCSCTEAVTRICISGATSEFRVKVWESLINQLNDKAELDVNVKFAFAEGLIRLALNTSTSVESPKVIELSNFSESLLSVLKQVELAVNQEGVSAGKKSNWIVSLLVLVKQYAAAHKDKMSVDDVKNILTIFLRFMKEKDAFVQDISCMGICVLYGIASSARDTKGDVIMVTNNGKSISLADFVAYEVTVVLTRQKKASQPAGYSVAGEASSTSTTASNSTTNASESSGNSRPRPTTNSGVAGGGGGGAAAPLDPLAQAAAAAAAELGLSLDEVNGRTDPAGGSGVNASDSNAFDSDYGVYNTICRVVKKSGDSSVLFAVLALIHRDVTFGIEDTKDVYERYAPAKIVINQTKLTVLLPLLYHARFNPNTVVKDIMKKLWQDLMPDLDERKTVVGKYQKEILAFCVTNLANGQWREREASCCALEALLPVCTWENIFAQVENLYSSGLNVLDDVRNSTRGIAINYMKALATILVRSCNPDETPIEAVLVNLDCILKLLTTKGLLCSSAEGRGYSLGLLVKVINTAHAHLNDSWLDTLISVLIESMSALEPATLQYMSFHTSRLAIKDEDLEAMRIKNSQSSPMQEALTVCLQSLRPSSLTVAIHNIVVQLRSGVGLATRAVAAESLCYLVEKYPKELSSETDSADGVVVNAAARVQILASVETAFRSVLLSLSSSTSMAATLKKTMSNALGILAKVVNKSALVRESLDLISRYNALSTNDSHESLTLASCIQQIVTRSGDRLEDAAVWNKILTAGFIGSYDSEAESSAVWTRVFSDGLIASGCGTKLAALQRIADIFFPSVVLFVNDLSWLKRSQGIAVLRDYLSGGVGADVIASRIGPILAQFLLSLKGKIWSHQGLVLETIVDILCKCHSNLDTTAPDELVFRSSTGSLMVDQLIGAGAVPFDVGSIGQEWKIGASGIARLLLSECDRGTANGNKEYALHGSRAVNGLPWALIVQSNPAVFFSQYDQLTRQADIFDVSSRSLTPAAPTVKTAAPVVNSGQRGLNINAMFGNRYGTSGVASTSASSTAVSGVRAGQRRKLSNDTASPSSSGVSVGQTASPVVVEEDTIIIDASTTPEVMMVVEPSETTSPTVSAPAPVETDPAYRMMFLDCLSKCIAAIPSASPSIDVVNVTRLLDWTKVILTSEVWSIRRSAIQLLGAVGGKIELDQSQLTSLLWIASKGLEDVKYVKIRTEALKTVRLTCGLILNKRLIASTSELNSSVAAMIRQASSDNQPSVLEEGGKLQQVWIL